jgi:hypothetical protein
MRTTANIAHRLTMFGNNAPPDSPYRRICIEAADRLNVLHVALDDLMQDRQHIDHSCKDLYCPVARARQVLCLGM